jgi:hypothetical protein
LKAGILGEDPSAPAGEDYRSLAEFYGVDGKLVDPALRNLEVVAAEEPNAGGSTRCLVRYSPGDSRPVLIHQWTERDRVAEEVDEASNRLSDREGIVARHLRETKEVIGIELGASQLKDMGVVLAYEVARYLGARCDGLVKNDLGEWLEIKKGGFIPIK